MAREAERAEEQQSDSKYGALAPKKLPKGVVLGPDGKPCRSCTSFAAWAAMSKASSNSGGGASAAPASECPADVDTLGRATWTFLHTLTAAYPARPAPALQAETAAFVRSLGTLYPCHACARDFEHWVRADGNAPRVQSRDDFGRWMCDAHNAVNVKLGKPVFDCNRWEERWRTGWSDGRCG